ncbi:hypothetical protein [Paracoccus rhizosphaerae]|uniref:Uncharacterized protein n=1 Tax=Paracoccus rhizosphaerae TaxID=1133347 RepID=A0ABV6CRD2_9RHOB|nr:hypothetical protein [Paracoccus rhizosphaerae]
MTDPVTSDMVLKCLEEMQRDLADMKSEMARTGSELREMKEQMASFLQARSEKQQQDFAAGRSAVEDSSEVDRLWAETRRMEAETAKLMAEDRKRGAEELRGLRQENRYIFLQTLVMMALGAATVFGTAYLMLYVVEVN